MSITYTLIMLTAIVTGFGLARLTQNKLDIPVWKRIGLGAGAFIGAMIGAKLPFLFDDWETFLNGAAWFSSGKTILTGLVGGYLGVEVAKWSFDVRTKTGDSFVVPVAAAIAIGRLGCFQAGCCHGQPTDLPWGVVFRCVDTLPRHPTQLYEFAFHAAAAAVFYWMQCHDLFRHNRIKLYLIAYAVYRFFSEWLRPEAEIFFGFTGYQLASLVIIALFCWLWFRESSKLTLEPVPEPGP